MIKPKGEQEFSGDRVGYVFRYDDCEDTDVAEQVIRNALDRESNPETSSDGVVFVGHDNFMDRESWYFDGEPGVVDAFCIQLISALAERCPWPFTVFRYPGGNDLLH